MDQLHRLRMWLALALVVVVVAALMLWLRGTLSEDTTPTAPAHSPLSTPTASSPLPSPTPSDRRVARPPAGASAALLWVALGCVLALALAFLILRRTR